MSDSLPSVVDAVVDVLESLSLLETLSVENDHVLVAHHGNHVERELADELLPLVFTLVLVMQVTLHFLQKTVHVQVLQKATVVQLPQERVFL